MNQTSKYSGTCTTPVVNLLGVVLAGGASQRMGGANKALIRHQGRYLYQFAAENLDVHCQQVVISSNDNASSFKKAGYTVVPDGSFNGQGPLAGIYAAIEKLERGYLMIAPCDQLALPASVYATLLEKVTKTKGAFAKSAESPIPTCAVLPKSLQGALKEALENDQRRLLVFMRAHCEEVLFEDITFSNLNTPEDLKTDSR